MKKFTKILEQSSDDRFYKVVAQVELIIKAENEGEAGYKSDSTFSSIEGCLNYTIEDISETDERLGEGDL